MRLREPPSSPSLVSCIRPPLSALHKGQAAPTTRSTFSLAPTPRPTLPRPPIRVLTASRLARPSHAHVQLYPLALGRCHLVLLVSQGVISTLNAPRMCYQMQHRSPSEVVLHIWSLALMPLARPSPAHTLHARTSTEACWLYGSLSLYFTPASLRRISRFSPCT